MRVASREGPIGIKQIADALNISIGTVDRALHGRPGVSAKTREKVLRLAEKLEYKPNLAARNLKLNRHLRIGVFLPEQIAFFYDQLRDGIRAAAAHTVHGLKLDLLFHSYPRLGEGDIETLQSSSWQQFDGIILAPGNPASLAEFASSAAEGSLPIVYVSTDAPRTQRLSSVAVEGTVSGGIAAELLGTTIQSHAPVAAIVGDLKIHDHAEKLRGFAAGLATLGPHLSLLAAIESHESAEGAYLSTLDLLERTPELGGIYVSTANSLPVLRAMRERGQVGKVRLVTTDLFPEVITAIEAGHVLASVYQRPFVQGRLAFEVLARFLMTGERPDPVIRLNPHIVLRSNLGLFYESRSAQGAFSA